MSTEDLRTLALIAQMDPTQENLANLGAAYLQNMEVKHELKIEGRRWFNRSKGSTYHTASVTFNGEFVGKSGVAYGYDNQYEITGFHLALREIPYLPPRIGHEHLRTWAQRNNIIVVSEVEDVRRRRDL